MDRLVMIELDQRAVIRIGGPERSTFLQNLISADVTKLDAGQAVWSALLTPQGKYLFDFFLYPVDDTYLLDVETPAAADLVRRLMLYRLRAKATIDDVSDTYDVTVLLGASATQDIGLPYEPGATIKLDGGVAAVDPRVAQLGVRLIHSQTVHLPGTTVGTFADWDQLRLANGIPDGRRDLVVEKTTLLEAGFDELGGISFDKGCYVGQELTARMKYRGLLKKRLFPVEIEGNLPPPGTQIVNGSGTEIGEMRSSAGNLGLALIRIDAAEGPLYADGKPLRARRPAWFPTN